MDHGPAREPQLFRLWIATYADWRPTCWNESPPGARALEPVDDRLVSAHEAALFLEGFNGSMLQHDQPVWAVAVPITVRYEGDVESGASVRGFVFSDAAPANDSSRPDADTARAAAYAVRGEPDHGFDQSPHRSR